MKKSEFKMRIREEAKRKIASGSGTAKEQTAYKDRVEAGRKELLMKSAQGGDPKAMRIKNELMYLLNNYSPKYDMRVQQLIELWRTSNDPSYDVGIHVKFRRARQEHDRKANPY